MIRAAPQQHGAPPKVSTETARTDGEHATLSRSLLPRHMFIVDSFYDEENA